MTAQEYHQLKQFENRIVQLKLLKQYMETFLKCQPVHIEVHVSVLGHETKNIIPYLNDRITTEGHFLEESDDAKYIIQSLQARIDDLEKEFSEKVSQAT